MCNLLIAHRNFHWKCCNTVRPMNNEFLRSLIAKLRQCRTNMYLNPLCHTFTHFDVMLTAHILLNVSSKIVTCRTNGVITNDTTQRNDCNFGATTTNINDHITFRCLYINTNTDSSSHRFENQIHVTTVCMLCTVAHST